MSDKSSIPPTRVIRRPEDQVHICKVETSFIGGSTPDNENASKIAKPNTSRGLLWHHEL